MRHLYPVFFNHIKKSRLVEAGSTIITAFSGGKDSITLLLLLTELKKDIDFNLLAAYFNHQIRGDAQEEEHWVKDFCASRQIELHIGRADVIAYKTRHRLNLENAASILRFRFLKEVASRYKDARIATAHTRSDLTETFFIKLFRGSGIRGLSGIYSKIDENIIRPLLILSEKDILSFLERNNIQYYQDYTNKQDQFLRNRIRSTLLPEIEKIAPKIEEHIFKTVSLAQAEYEYFKFQAEKILAENLLQKKILPITILKRYHLAVQRHILREYIRLLKGNLLDLDFTHVENILKSLPSRRGIAVPGIELKFHKGLIYPKDLTIPGYHYRVKSPATVHIKEINIKIIIAKIEFYKKPTDNFEILIPSSLVKFPLTIRSPQKGDKYKKINSAFNQKVFEMIRSAGFPAELRPLCPLLLDADGQIIWLIGAPIADAFKVKDQENGPFLEISCK